MINPKTITITRVEGYVHECNKPKVAHSWIEADSILHRWSNTAPEHGGYDKCDFTVVFEDGETYEGRYDLVHWRCEAPNLANHISSFVNYLAGKPPAWLKRSDKKRYLEEYEREIAAHPERTAAARKWLETYSVSKYGSVT